MRLAFPGGLKVRAAGFLSGFRKESPASEDSADKAKDDKSSKAAKEKPGKKG